MALLPHSPAATQQAALARFFALLAGATLGTLILALLTLLALAGARAALRTTEIAVRRAVGASRRTLLAAALLEGGVIAVAALVPGVIAGGMGGWLASSGWPGTLGAMSPLPLLGVTVAVIGGVLLGALLTLLLAAPRRIVESPSSSVPLALPVLQLAVAFTLLVGSRLLTGHLAMQGEAVAHTLDGQLFRLATPSGSPAERAARYSAWLVQLGAHPELGVVSLTAAGGHVGLGTGGVVTTDCGQCSEGGLPLPWQQEFTVHQYVSADSFEALGLRVVEGRWITAADRWGTQPVAVVSRHLARQHFQGGEAVGRDLQIAGDRERWFRVVGVVDDPTPIAFGGGLQPPYTVYLSVLQEPVAAVELLVRPTATVPAASLSRAVSAVLGLGAVPAPPTAEATMIRTERAPLAWFATWLGVEGWALLLVALAGTVIVMQLWVRSVRAELGVRRAVGATRAALFGFILRRTAVVGMGGVGLGFWFGPVLWDALPTVAPGAATWSGGTVAPLAALLIGVTLCSVLVPAWRASRTPPAHLLQSPEG
jgi:hypothetical protein